MSPAAPVLWHRLCLTQLAGAAACFSPLGERKETDTYSSGWMRGLGAAQASSAFVCGRVHVTAGTGMGLALSQPTVIVWARPCALSQEGGGGWREREREDDEEKGLSELVFSGKPQTRPVT